MSHETAVMGMRFARRLIAGRQNSRFLKREPATAVWRQQARAKIAASATKPGASTPVPLPHSL